MNISIQYTQYKNNIYRGTVFELIDILENNYFSIYESDDKSTLYLKDSKENKTYESLYRNVIYCRKHKKQYAKGTLDMYHYTIWQLAKKSERLKDLLKQFNNYT